MWEGRLYLSSLPKPSTSDAVSLQGKIKRFRDQSPAPPVTSGGSTLGSLRQAVRPLSRSMKQWGRWGVLSIAEPRAQLGSGGAQEASRLTQQVGRVPEMGQNVGLDWEMGKKAKT